MSAIQATKANRMGNYQRLNIWPVNVFPCQIIPCYIGMAAVFLSATGLLLADSSQSRAVFDVWWVLANLLGFLLCFHTAAYLFRRLTTVRMIVAFEYLSLMCGLVGLVVSYLRLREPGSYYTGTVSQWAFFTLIGALAMRATCTSVQFFRWHKDSMRLRARRPTIGNQSRTCA